MPDAAPSPSAVRKREERQRRREGMRYMKAYVPADVVVALIENGWLGQCEGDLDARELGDALIDLADCWMHGTLESSKP